MRRRQFLLAGTGGTLALACGGESTLDGGGGGSNGGGSNGGGEGPGSGGESMGSGGETAVGGASSGGNAGAAGGSAEGGSGGGEVPGGGGDPGVAGSAGAGGAPAPTCGLTTAPNIEGPFFKVDSPERSNIRQDATVGTLITLRGTVYGPGCAPLAGALLDFWQADETGAYDTLTYTYRGHQFTDAEGRYELTTIIPGRYLNGATYRPAHIHVKAAGLGTLLLTTQLYFEGDPFNVGDPFIVPSLIMSPVDDGAGALVATFDFVLAAA